ncbi:MAG: glycine cleavage system protein GcvH [Peptococcaceae bacterium]|jgi:glycine cleavage system H protein|nr:glycine cleavage system protein GcvH [Peptococcaceae bacterium]
MYPNHLKYSEEHTWLELDGDAGRVGITDHAQEALGDIVFVELPQAGDEVTQNEAFGSVESVKSVNDLYAPVSGKVTEVNGRLNDHPEIINKDPYGDGWIIKIRPSDLSELENLLDAAGYQKSIVED